jgi:hypothetical protein
MGKCQTIFTSLNEFHRKIFTFIISPVGIMIAGAKGVLRSMLCNGEYLGECIPVDFAINGIIGVAKTVAEIKEK